MLEAIEKLLILQDRDRKIIHIKDELTRIPYERNDLQNKLTSAQTGLDAAKTKVKQLESERKRLELEVDAKKGLIDKYSIQQFQTKKNEEYRALAHEIEMCKEAIGKLDDQQIDLMEQGEGAQKVVNELTANTNEARKKIESRIADLSARETKLKGELAEIERERAGLADGVQEDVRSKYERLLKSKGGNVVVGIAHGVCGGCHMQLSRQTMVWCQADQEIVTCTNCGRILYYSSDMDLAIAE